MINEWEQLGIVLMALIIVEWFFVLRPGSTAFVGVGGRLHLFQATAEGVRALPRIGPLLPMGVRFRAETWPCSVSPDGLQAGRALHPGDTDESPGSRVLAFEDWRHLRVEGRTLRSAGVSLGEFSSSHAAKDFLALLASWYQRPPDERPDAIRQALDARMDTDAVRRRLQEFETHAWLLASLCMCLFLFCVFLVVMVFVDLRWVVEAGRPLLGSWLVLLLLHSIAFFRAHRRFRPGRNAERARNLVLHVFVPAVAVQAHVELSQGVLSQYEPVAIASVLLPKHEFHALARRCLLPDIPESHPPRPVTWLRSQLQERVRGILGDEVSAVLAPPVERDVNARAYCRRCHTQYVVSAGSCALCDGMELVTFGPASP